MGVITLLVTALLSIILPGVVNNGDNTSAIINNYNLVICVIINNDNNGNAITIIDNIDSVIVIVINGNKASVPSPLLRMAITLLPLLVMDLLSLLLLQRVGVKSVRIPSIISHNADSNDFIVIGNSVSIPHFDNIDKIDSLSPLMIMAINR